MPPPTTERTTTNIKTKNYNCQKIKLYGSLTTRVKEETFIHTDRRGRDGQPGKTGCRAGQQMEDQVGEVASGPAVLLSHADKPGGTTGD